MIEKRTVAEMQPKFRLDSSALKYELIINLQNLRTKSAICLVIKDESTVVELSAIIKCLEEAQVTEFNRKKGKIQAFQRTLAKLAPDLAKNLSLRADGDYGAVTKAIIEDLILQLIGPSANRIKYCMIEIGCNTPELVVNGVVDNAFEGSVFRFLNEIQTKDNINKMILACKKADPVLGGKLVDDGIKGTQIFLFLQAFIKKARKK